MSSVKYILQSCDTTLRFRVEFTGATNLDVGETWYLECDGITNGCYQVENDTQEPLDEYNVDDCMFIEYDDCDNCDVDNSLSSPTQLCYNFRKCVSDDRPFPYNQISYVAGSPYSTNQTVLFESTANPTLNQVACFDFLSTGITTPTANVAALTGFTRCTNCQAECPQQDFVFLIDQSTSISDSQFELMKDGINNIADILEGEMDLGLVQMSAYKWSSCGNVDLIVNLTSNHTSFTNAISSTTKDGGLTNLGQAMVSGHNQLFGSNGNEYANKTMIVLTDGAIADFNYGNCGTNPLPVTTLATLMKTGLYNGVGTQMKLVAINLINGNQQQLESIVSSSDDYFFASSYSQWESTVSGEVADIGCDEDVDFGGADKQSVWLTDPCCSEVPPIYVLLNSDYTPPQNSGFQYGETCYEFDQQVSDVFSALTSYSVLTGDVINNICSSSSNPDCGCSKINIVKLRNCCDSTDTVTVSYDSSIVTMGAGVGTVLSGTCYEFDSVVTGTADVHIYDSVLNICDVNFGSHCIACTPSATPSTSPIPTPSTTPSVSTSSTPAVTPTVTPTTTPTVTPSTSLPLVTAQKFSAVHNLITKI